MICFALFFLMSYAELSLIDDERDRRLESAGWVAVNRPAQEELPTDEDNSNLWVVFGKRGEHEAILVRFPKEPTYHYEGKRMEVYANQGEQKFFLSIEPASKQSMALERNLFYREEGRWIQERWIATNHTIYFLQSSSPTPLSEESEFFVRSFQCESIAGMDHKYGFS